MKAIIALCLFVAVAFAANGFDVSTAVSQSAYSCLAQKGYSYAIIRCFRSSGTVDPNCASNVANAKAAGLSVSVYMFPCPKCSSGSTQMNTLVSYLSSNNVDYDTIWLDIEGTQYWSTVSANQAFFQDMVETGNSLGAKLGVYTSSVQWNPIMGSSTAGSSMPLWYAHYDNQPSFSDFSPFGGWSSPAMKQYNGGTNTCGAGLDLNFMPGGSTSATATSSGNSGNSNSGNSGNSGHSGSGNSGSGNSGSHSGSGNSGSGNSGSHSGSGNSGSGNSGSGNSGSGNSGNGNTGTNSGTSYSSGGGSSSSSGGSDFLSEDAIYSKIGGKQDKMAATKNARKLTSRNNNRKNKVDMLIERDVDVAVESHFKVVEEKSAKKFF